MVRRRKKNTYKKKFFSNNKKKTGKKGSKLKVKRQFKNAFSRLRRMKAKKQRAAAVGASEEFIRDVSKFMNKVRSKPHLLNSSHRRVLQKHKKKLRKLVHAKTPLYMKRFILSQKGGILPALVPVIVALIGAGGSIAAGATSAAILKNK